MRASLLIILGLLLSGCFLHHASAGEKLSKAVQEMNKSTRWGQIGSASGMVDGSYRKQFLESHRHWGSAVQVADTEIVHMEVANGSESAISVVAYSWYATESMTLHASLVRQRWTKEGQGFALISETVIDGDARLLNKEAKNGPAMVRDPLSMSGDSASGVGEDEDHSLDNRMGAGRW
jgi:hypothetical protein